MLNLILKQFIGALDSINLNFEVEKNMRNRLETKQKQEGTAKRGNTELLNNYAHNLRGGLHLHMLLK